MTRAASSLGVTQPALSAMLKKLEAEVGADLLDRTGRGVTPTEAGRVFLEYAEDAVRRADAGVEAVRELKGLQRGSIRIGGGATATTYLLPRVVSGFRLEHPAIRFSMREAGSLDVARLVAQGELDLGVVTAPIDAALAGDLVVIPLVEDELRLIVPPGHRLESRRTFRWTDLEGEPVVGFEAGSAVRTVIDRAAMGAGVALDVVMELRSIESIKRMVATGIGVGFVSRFALDEGGDKPRGLGCRDGKVSRSLAIVRRSDRSPSAAVAALERQLLDAARRSRSARS